MLAEEQTSHKPMESVDVGGSSSIINDGRWVPPGDFITSRHNKRGDVNFADGHAEIKKWKDPDTLSKKIVATPKAPRDVPWTQLRTSAPKDESIVYPP